MSSKLLEYGIIGFAIYTFSQSKKKSGGGGGSSRTGSQVGQPMDYYQLPYTPDKGVNKRVDKINAWANVIIGGAGKLNDIWQSWRTPVVSKPAVNTDMSSGGSWWDSVNVFGLGR